MASKQTTPERAARGLVGISSTGNRRHPASTQAPLQPAIAALRRSLSIAREPVLKEQLARVIAALSILGARR